MSATLWPVIQSTVTGGQQRAAQAVRQWDKVQPSGSFQSREGPSHRSVCRMEASRAWLSSMTASSHGGGGGLLSRGNVDSESAERKFKF